MVSETVSLTEESYTVSDDIFNAITNLDRFAKILREKRMRQGALSFDRVEIKFNLDKENNPESVFFKSSQDAHKLVEEFMLLANRKVAEFIGKQKPIKPFVYRIHDEPDSDKLNNLQMVVSNFGYKNIPPLINRFYFVTCVIFQYNTTFIDGHGSNFVMYIT